MNNINIKNYGVSKICQREYLLTHLLRMRSESLSLKMVNWMIPNHQYVLDESDDSRSPCIRKPICTISKV